MQSPSEPFPMAKGQLRIEPSKIVYLLSYRKVGDKSKALGQGGFSITNPEALRVGIERLFWQGELVADGDDGYGPKYKITGLMQGTLGESLEGVTLALLHRPDLGIYDFITLFLDIGRK
jgi:hypothetical protein